MKLSIIICTYNSVGYLETALPSILVQTFKDYEVLIIDGTSTDGTLGIINDYKNKFAGKLRWISEKDAGIYDAMNKGIDLAQGEWLYFLGSDDVFFDENVLGRVAKELDGDVSVVYGDVAIENDGRLYDGIFIPEKLIEKNISHQAIFYKKNIFDLLGKYNIEYKTLADWDFNMRWMNSGDIKNKYVSSVIARLSKGGASKKIFDQKFYADFEENIKKYFPVEYLQIYKKGKKREINFLKSKKKWMLWEWKNKIEFTLFHPIKFLKKHIKK